MLNRGRVLFTTTQSTNVTYRKLRRHQALVTKSASLTQNVRLAPTMRHGQAEATTGVSSLDFSVINSRTTSHETQPAVYEKLRNEAFPCGNENYRRKIILCKNKIIKVNFYLALFSKCFINKVWKTK